MEHSFPTNPSYTQFSNSPAQQLPQSRQSSVLTPDCSQPFNGSEVHLSSLKSSFKQAANSLTQLYKQASFSYNVSYQQGKQDAFEEVLHWFMSQTNEDGQLKNVSNANFYQFMNEKINQQKQETQQAFDTHHQYSASLMPPPPNRQPIQTFPRPQINSSDLIEMAANQSLQEEGSSNGGVEVVRKVNLNFGGLKINESKKRMRTLGQPDEKEIEDNQQMEVTMDDGQSQGQMESESQRRILKAKRMKQQ